MRYLTLAVRFAIISTLTERKEENMMKLSMKKMAAFVVAIVLVCTLFVGCGAPKYDTSTPEGTLIAQLNAIKTGDFTGLKGYDKDQFSKEGISEAQVKDLMTSFFGKSEYKIEGVKPISDTEAEVSVSGKAVDMSKFMPVVIGEFTARYTDFASKGGITNATTQSELTKQMFNMIIDSAKAKKSDVTLKDVKVTVTMEKKDDVWDVNVSDDDNMNQIFKLLTGSTLEQLTKSVQEMFGGKSPLA